MFEKLFQYVSIEQLILGIGVLALIAIFFSLYLVFRVTALTKGASGSSLEETITDNKKRVADLEEHCLSEAKKVAHIDGRLKTSTRAVAIERFDPFQQQGGQQSFSSALINESGDGVVLSALHSRDGVRVYAKELKEFTSTIELSEEEARAVTHAKKKL